MNKIELNKNQMVNKPEVDFAVPVLRREQAFYKGIITFSSIIMIDLVAVSISLLLAYLTRNYLLAIFFPTLITGPLLAYTFELFWWYPLAFIACLAYEKLYHKRLPFWIEVQWILKAGTLTLFLSVVILYLVQIGDEISRSLVLLTWLFAMLMLPLLRYYGKKLLLKLKIWNKPVIVIGNSQTIPLLGNAFKREATMGYEVVGCITSNGAGDLNSELKAGKSDQTPPCLGQLADVKSIIKAAGVEDIIIAEPNLTSTEQVKLTNIIQPLVKNITLVPDLFGISLSGIEAAYLFEEQVVLLQIKNQLRLKSNAALKRIFDLVLGTLIFILALPLMLGLAVAVRLDSKGPSFYVSRRLGREGRDFSCIKFRTMYLDADQILKQYVKENEKARSEWSRYNKLISFDPRVTPVGRILRRLSLDELPQLLNILRGEMSLVGPRPYLPREKDQMGYFAYDILIGKPGLAGLWQVSGRNRLTFESRLKLDAWYMKNWSLWLDLVLMLKTIRVVMKRDGAY